MLFSQELGGECERRSEFAGWSDDLVALLSAAKRTGRWALLDRDQLPRWTLRHGFHGYR
ncbi:hypothetical protein [Nonomuraea sp. NPDC049480]|uniref:hypothetical protein n=1 Tax=Nonomuraea sp. NPDC049480 TaxID=3364353 RepID=UPI003797C8B6